MIIHIVPTGNFGNRALQYFAAAGIQSHAPGAKIQNIELPEAGINQPAPAPDPQNSVATGRGWLDIAGFADCLARGVIETIRIEDYPYHLQNFPPRAAARNLIPPLPGGQNATGFGPNDLVCSIRGAEILRAIHPDYLVLPPAYYQMLARRTGKNLVFFGQIGDDPYSASLRRAFPAAAFIQSGGLEHDFETLRRSVHIAPSVSTFAWLAAWLSHANKIYLPVCGFFNPVQHAEQLFLPLDDESYEYTLFPYAKATDVWAHTARFFLQQEVLAQGMRPVMPDELLQIITRMRAFHPRLPYAAGFDPDFYLTQYADVRAAVADGSQPSALHHYVHAGFAEKRLPLALDSGFYASTYPDAALAIAEGHYADPLHHYQAVGFAKGYRPLP
jgi:hypothetical protein